MEEDNNFDFMDILFFVFHYALRAIVLVILFYALYKL